MRMLSSCHAPVRFEILAMLDYVLLSIIRVGVQGMTSTLYERLGGTEGITKIASDLTDIHLANPRIAPRYAKSDVTKVKNGVATFFIAGTGGPDVYQGEDMLSTHRGMNIDSDEFIAVLDDALEALEKNNVGQREKEEVLYILYGMKSDVAFV